MKPCASTLCLSLSLFFFLLHSFSCRMSYVAIYPVSCCSSQRACSHRSRSRMFSSPSCLDRLPAMDWFLSLLFPHSFGTTSLWISILSFPLSFLFLFLLRFKQCPIAYDGRRVQRHMHTRPKGLVGTLGGGYASVVPRMVKWNITQGTRLSDRVME